MFRWVEVLDLDEQRADTPRRPRSAARALPDVGPRLRSRPRRVGVEAAPVVPLEREAHHEALALRLLPVDLEPALRLVREQQQVRDSRRGGCSRRARASRSRPPGRPAPAGSTARSAPSARRRPGCGRPSTCRARDRRAARSRRLRRLRVFGVELGIERLSTSVTLHVALPDRRDQLRRVREPSSVRRGVRADRRPASAAPALDLALEDLLPERLGRRSAPRAGATGGSCAARGRCARARASRASASPCGDVMISTVSEFLQRA